MIEREGKNTGIRYERVKDEKGKKMQKCERICECKVDRQERRIRG